MPDALTLPASAPPRTSLVHRVAHGDRKSCDSGKDQGADGREGAERVEAKEIGLGRGVRDESEQSETRKQQAERRKHRVLRLPVGARLVRDLCPLHAGVRGAADRPGMLPAPW